MESAPADTQRFRRPFYTLNSSHGNAYRCTSFGTPLSLSAFCVRTVSHAPRNYGQTPSFTGTRRRISMLREVVDGECVGEIWCASACVNGLAFQACSFNHSDISPYL